MSKEKYIKNCPQCKSEIIYYNKSTYKNSIKKNRVCRKCASQNSGFTLRYGNKENNSGENNPFYGKKHTIETIEILKKVNKYYTKTDEFAKKMSSVTSGEKNPMFGKSVYELWIKKYGIEIANQKKEELRKKQSINSSGENNPMYGKASPHGSGNGWKGWYKNLYFRSLRELAFMLKMDEENIIWKKAENIKITYENYDGTKRTYCPDFIIGNRLIEIKPTKLINSPLIKLKTKAAEKYCIANNLIFEIIDVDIDFIKIKTNVDNKNIIFEKRYENKYNEYLIKIKKEQNE